MDFSGPAANYVKTPPLESLLIHIFSLAEASHPVHVRDPKGHPTIWKNAGPNAVALNALFSVILW